VQRWEGWNRTVADLNLSLGPVIAVPSKEALDNALGFPVALFLGRGLDVQGLSLEEFGDKGGLGDALRQLHKETEVLVDGLGT
jgi:hypothetical protein